MASTILEQDDSSVATETETKPQKKQKKLRKKNARRVAKIQLQLGQAHKGVQKAEQKVVKAQSKLEEKKGYVQTLSEKLTRLHAEQSAITNGSNTDEQSSLSLLDTNLGAEDNEANGESALSSSLPAEGRDDIPLGVQDEEITSTEGSYKSPLSDTTGPVEESSNLPDEDAEASKETHLFSLPPAEGRDDIMDTDTQDSAEDEDNHAEDKNNSNRSSRSRRRSHS